MDEREDDQSGKARVEFSIMGSSGFGWPPAMVPGWSAMVWSDARWEEDRLVHRRGEGAIVCVQLAWIHRLHASPSS